MQNFGTLPLNFVYILLLIVPGLIGIDLCLQFSKTGEQTRIQTVVYSVGVSLLSIGLLYVSSPLFFELVSDTATSLANRLGW